MLGRCLLVMCVYVFLMCSQSRLNLAHIFLFTECIVIFLVIFLYLSVSWAWWDWPLTWLTKNYGTQSITWSTSWCNGTREIITETTCWSWLCFGFCSVTWSIVHIQCSCLFVICIFLRIYLIFKNLPCIDFII